MRGANDEHPFFLCVVSIALLPRNDVEIASPSTVRCPSFSNVRPLQTESLSTSVLPSRVTFTALAFVEHELGKNLLDAVRRRRVAREGS